MFRTLDGGSILDSSPGVAADKSLGSDAKNAEKTDDSAHDQL